MSTPRLVKDIKPGSRGSYALELTEFGSTLYFSADDGVSGYEFWKSDGSAAGTVRIKDINPGPGNSYLFWLRAVGNTLYFTAEDGVSGEELWKSDGTDAGTVRIQDINPGRNSSAPKELTGVGGRLYFTADDGTRGRRLWTSDGTTTGTTTILAITPGNPTAGESPQGLTAVGNLLFFTATDGAGKRQLWTSNGTTAGTSQLTTHTDGLSPESLTAVGNRLYFSAQDGPGNRELWTSNGTAAGTIRVKDIKPGAPGSNPRSLTAVGNTLYFRADDGSSGEELWKSDGTSGGTVRVRDIQPGSGSGLGFSIPNLTALGNTLYFTAEDGVSGVELWKSDGTTVGTVRVKDIRPGAMGSAPRELKAVGKTLYFSADDGVNGRELWASNGTAAGTVRVGNLGPGAASSNPSYFGSLGTSLFFTAKDGVRGEELWTVDPPPPAPVITLTLARASVTEDGPTNLLYTFTRTGSTAAALTVMYTAGGTATPGADYTGIGATPAIRSITFAAGSATATVSVDPTADRIQEANETVVLRLLAGAGYTLGTTTAVTGSLLNDDRIGTAASNTIIGTAISEFIDGMEANDSLTGGTGPDVFGFRYGHSPLSSPDRITDFQFGTDRVDLFTSRGAGLPAPTGLTRASDNSTATTLAALTTAVFSDADGSRAGKQALGANRAALVVASGAAIAGTYLVINDGIAARNTSNDLLIHLTGVSGALPGLGVIPVGTVFA